MDKLFRERDDERASYSTYCKLITAFLSLGICRLQAFAISVSETLIQLTWGIIYNFKSNFKQESKRGCSNVNVLCRRANCDETTNIRQVYRQ